MLPQSQPLAVEVLLSTRLHWLWPYNQTLKVSLAFLLLPPLTLTRLQATLQWSAPTKPVSKPTRITLVLLASQSKTTWLATLSKINWLPRFPQLLDLVDLVVLLSTRLHWLWPYNQTLKVSLAFLLLPPLTLARLQATLQWSAPTKPVFQLTPKTLVLLASKSLTTFQATLLKTLWSLRFPQQLPAVAVVVLLSTRLHCKWPSALTNLKSTKTLLQSAATQRKLPPTVPVSRLFLLQLVQVLPVTWARLQPTLPLSPPTKAISKPTRITLVL